MNIQRVAQWPIGLLQGPEYFYLKVFDADRDTVRHVIRNFALLNLGTEPFASIYDHLDATLRPAICEAAVKYGIGDAKRFIDEAIRTGSYPLLRASNFASAFTRLYQHMIMNDFCIRFQKRQVTK
jgi:hypothetical protein